VLGKGEPGKVGARAPEFEFEFQSEFEFEFQFEFEFEFEFAASDRDEEEESEDDDQRKENCFTFWLLTNWANAPRAEPPQAAVMTTLARSSRSSRQRQP
jgi:hypothetical protein